MATRQYAFSFHGDTILVRADSERAACCRAFFEVCTSYEIDPDRLHEMEWPADADFEAFDLAEPVILEGG